MHREKYYFNAASEGVKVLCVAEVSKVSVSKFTNKSMDFKETTIRVNNKDFKCIARDDGGIDIEGEIVVSKDLELICKKLLELYGDDVLTEG